MATCPMCDSEIADNNRALKQVSLEETVSRLGGWSSFESCNVGYPFTAGPYKAKLEAAKLDPGYPPHTYDGSYEQGETFEAHIVIEVEGDYFKKTGTGDSYGEINWDGSVKPVVATTKLVKVFE